MLCGTSTPYHHEPFHIWSWIHNEPSGGFFFEDIWTYHSKSPKTQSLGFPPPEMRPQDEPSPSVIPQRPSAKPRALTFARAGQRGAQHLSQTINIEVWKMSSAWESLALICGVTIFFFFSKVRVSDSPCAWFRKCSATRLRPPPSITSALIMKAFLCADVSVTNIDEPHHWRPALAVSRTMGLSQLTVET